MSTQKNPRGFVFARGARLYIGFKEGAKWRRMATGIENTPQGWKQAEKVLEIRNNLLAAGDELGVLEGKVTVRVWGERWIARRKAKGLAVANEDEHRLRHHVYPAIGGMLLEEVRPRHIQAIVDGLAQKPATGRKGPLAPRTVRHIYATVQGLFTGAVVADLLRDSPCSRGKIELPELMDKDPTWRETAVFGRAEAEALMGDERIQLDRRELYTLLFCTGLRFSEASALTWRNWTPDLEPLGRLTITAGWNTRRKRLGRTKTKRARLVPVHPVLAKVLAARKLRMGAGDDDRIFPAKRTSSGFSSVGTAYKGLLHDMETLGLRHRRLHDMRRTFLSLALTDGARPEILRLITHGPGSAVFDLYTSIPWRGLCEAVEPLRLEPCPTACPIPLGARKIA